MKVFVHLFQKVARIQRRVALVARRNGRNPLCVSEKATQNLGCLFFDANVNGLCPFTPLKKLLGRSFLRIFKNFQKGFARKGDAFDSPVRAMPSIRP